MNMKLSLFAGCAIIAMLSFMNSGDAQYTIAEQFDKGVQNVAAGDPSSFWSFKSKQRPLPTNKYWQNFVLNSGSAPEYIHPYSIQAKNGSLAISYPQRHASSKMITQVHTDDLVVYSKENFGASHGVSRFDDLTVTLTLGKMRAPLLRGSPYVTLIFSEGAPVFSTVHSVTSVSKNFDSTKHTVNLNNGQKWLIFSSAPLPLSDADLTCDGSFTGVIRVAALWNGSSEDILDSFSRSYAVSGRTWYSISEAGLPEIKYAYKTEGDGELLLLSLPLHRDIFVADSVREVAQVNYASIDGQLLGAVGTNWHLQLKDDYKLASSSLGWHSSSGIQDPAARDRISAALAQDIESLKPVNTTSTYFFGKAVARAARLGMIAEEMQIAEAMETVRLFLTKSLSPWLDGEFSGNAIVYDSKWGGLVSRQGAFDSTADFGLGVYNDHHFHWGYFVYAGAVLAKLDADWGSKYKTTLYSLVGDYMSLGKSSSSSSSSAAASSSSAASSSAAAAASSSSSAAAAAAASSSSSSSPQNNNFFPRLRHFDAWLMHSWAGGLSEFGDGRNQESSSEAVNAYYAASLLGNVYGDESTEGMGKLLTGLESYGAKSLWHVKEGSSLYDSEYVGENRVTGVVWANKRDSGLWFGCQGEGGKECRLGIQIIPVTPATELLMVDKEYNEQLFSWASASLVSDSWKGFAFALQATYDPSQASINVDQLKAFDDGNSLTNILWWIHTQRS